MNDEQKALLEETKRLHQLLVELRASLAEIERRGLPRSDEQVATDELLLAWGEHRLAQHKERLLKCLLYPAAEL